MPEVMLQQCKTLFKQVMKARTLSCASRPLLHIARGATHIAVDPKGPGSVSKLAVGVRKRRAGSR